MTSAVWIGQCLRLLQEEGGKLREGVLYVGTCTIYIYTQRTWWCFFFSVPSCQSQMLLQYPLCLMPGSADAFHPQLLPVEMGPCLGAKRGMLDQLWSLKYSLRTAGITSSNVQMRFKLAQPVLQAL